MLKYFVDKTDSNGQTDRVKIICPDLSMWELKIINHCNPVQSALADMVGHFLVLLLGISLGECNTILSAYRLYRHLG